MTKMKIVIKVPVKCERCRAKAMELGFKSSNSAGVLNSVAMEGNERDQLAVVGEGIDSVTLAKNLRKKLGWADIVKVEEVKEEKKEEKKESSSKIECIHPCYPPCRSHTVMIYEDNPSGCSIM